MLLGTLGASLQVIFQQLEELLELVSNFFDSFGVENIPKEIKKFIGNKDIKTNNFRMQAYDAIMYGYFRIEFIGFMLAGKTLTEFTNLFSPNNFKGNDDIILNFFYG